MNDKIIEYYNSYDEAGRLFRNYSHQIEWLTTIHYFDKQIPPASTIFDGCAGTGNYAFRLAEQGHHVIASDIVPHNVDIMLEAQKKNPILKDIFVGDICQPNHYADEFFDVVLCMGAFYHLDKVSRQKAMEQCLRLLKPDGILVITYINLTAALYLNLDPGLGNIDKILKCYDTKTFGDAFIYMTPDEIRQTAKNNHLKILCHLTSDGNFSMRNPEFNRARQEDFEKYMEFHLQTCEDKNILGYGLHGLVFMAREQAYQRSY